MNELYWVKLTLTQNGPRLQSGILRFKGPSVIEVTDSDNAKAIEKINAVAAEVVDRKALEDLLSGVERLRKRDAEDGEDPA